MHFSLILKSVDRFDLIYCEFIFNYARALYLIHRLMHKIFVITGINFPTKFYNVLMSDELENLGFHSLVRY